mmetsp:Transcript_79149/g.228908  ORF Transcript_79149/g.228908 Transcript_79149/m.228908 type:complete len:360 (-) Transcript_79149:177-1256(-)
MLGGLSLCSPVAACLNAAVPTESVLSPRLSPSHKTDPTLRDDLGDEFHCVHQTPPQPAGRRRKTTRPARSLASVGLPNDDGLDEVIASHSPDSATSQASTCHAAQLAYDRPCALAWLPDELLEAVCVLVGGSANDGTLRLGTFGAACPRLRHAVGSAGVLIEIAKALDAPVSLSTSLRLLALHQSFEAAGPNRVDFEVAADTIDRRSRGGLQHFAKLMRRFPETTLWVEVHSGGGNSRMDRKEERAQLQLSRARAESIVMRMAEHGVDSGRLLTRAWGAELPEATPGASVYLFRDGIVLPSRPAYYPSEPPKGRASTARTSTSASPPPSAAFARRGAAGGPATRAPPATQPPRVCIVDL